MCQLASRCLDPKAAFDVDGNLYEALCASPG
jgi:hypothetical protein